MIEGWYDFTLKETGIRIDYVLLLILLFLIFIIYSRLVFLKRKKAFMNEIIGYMLLFR